MIIGYIGNIGSGKTLSMIKDAYILYRQGYNIYSNIKLNFPYKPYDFDMIMSYSKDNISFYKAVFLLDEAHIFIDSRTSASKTNRMLSYFILQTRKKDVMLFYTTQYIHQIDKRLRATTDAAIECYNKTFNEMLYIMNRINIFKMEGIITVNHIFKANKFFKLYDTYEVVRPITNDF